jgi:hypothetical protein
MGRRRRGDDFEGLVGPIAVILFLLGAVIIAFLRALLLAVLIGGGSALACFLLYRLGRRLWERQLDIETYLPRIDWSLPAIPSFGTGWVDIRYPEFSTPSPVLISHVIGTSGAWKDVLVDLARFPALRNTSGPEDLRQRVSACEAAAADMLRQASAVAGELAWRTQVELEQQITQWQGAEKILEGRVRPQMERLQCAIQAMSSGHFLDRLKANRLRSRLSQYEIQLSGRHHEVREMARRQEQAVRSFLNPAQRERTLQERIQQDLARMKEVVTSKEFAGAAAEVAVIEVLSSLAGGSMIFNDVKLEAGRYIHFGGKPLMSAQIDTLAITTAGVFVVEVKNWSREFAHSGEGFSPYEQANRASYLVFDRLRSAGISIKVQAIIATNGSLPEKGEHKVAVVSIGRLRRYIQGAPAAQVDVLAVRQALGL